MNSQTTPLVSIVTPVYNGEKYLAECIESILKQTYTNWQYIIVNNCSTDKTVEIAQSYAQKDSRIQIHHNDEFLTSLQNQNKAIRQTHPESKYCKVVHADDWLFPECLEKMVELAEQNPTIGIVGSYRILRGKSNEDRLPSLNKVMSGHEVARLQLSGKADIFGTPTSILLRSELVHQRNPFYDEANLQADTAVCYDLLQTSDFGFVDQVLTYTRLHKMSQTSFMERVGYRPWGGIRFHLKYAPIYLNEEENQRLLSQKLKRYYRYLLLRSFGFLNKRFIGFPRQEFWDFHQQEPQKLGYNYNSMAIFFKGIWALTFWQ